DRIHRRRWDHDPHHPRRGQLGAEVRRVPGAGCACGDQRLDRLGTAVV
ncbi:MAG: hypothetical protein, partial [Olavius algarvensis Gamma 1 endosymbiont]